MFTVCTNANCGQRYRIKPEIIGMTARCKKCSNVFEVSEFIEKKPLIELDQPANEANDTSSEDEDNSTAGGQTETGKKRRSPREVMEEHIDRIKQSVNSIIPRLNHSHKKQDNESDTRLLINQILQDVLGFRLEDIKTEQRVEGRKADYVISVGGQDALVIEAKRIGACLRDRQIFQATSYAAYGGIPWAILTNAWAWQLYHVSTGERIETDLIFTIDMMDGLTDQEAYWLYLVSRHGLSRKSLLADMWRRISALCCDNIVNAILSDEVISKIRKVLSRQTGYRMSNDELRQSLEENILQL